MTIDRWKQIEEIFQGALERSTSERKEYIAQACREDNELRWEVESLLASDGGESTLRSVVEADVRKLAQDPGLSNAGLQIGSYRLVRELGNGGMGVVYLAVRSDSHYFQIVAIKMVRKGLEWPSLVQRFRAERQILATLSHPNIAAILDGGETEDGCPFIVMEYVEGQPITLASKDRDLSIRQRIELFRSVCSAVHYAHQKLVIHRDLKPNNVRVTPEGIVKLIDFGISKSLARELIPGGPPRTESGFRLMTPDYASPEQLRGEELTIATDIYSLGVLLFELLTRSVPYEIGELSPVVAEKLICEEVRKPSSVAGLTDKARKVLEGDLDVIVCKAMDPEPSRRYRSAQHLQDDLDCFLESKPISAREPTLAYRLSKLITRLRFAKIGDVRLGE
jgi:serine/threonine protein kinase